MEVDLLMVKAPPKGLADLRQQQIAQRAQASKLTEHVLRLPWADMALVQHTLFLRQLSRRQQAMVLGLALKQAQAMALVQALALLEQPYLVLERRANIATAIARSVMIASEMKLRAVTRLSAVINLTF